jgi:hypothetical protein
VESERLRDYHRFNGFYINVRRKVSSFALDLMALQISKTHPLQRCSGSIMRVYGVPCAHVLDEKISIGGVLEIEDFSQQWWLDDVHCVPVYSVYNKFARIRNLTNAGENSANSILVDLRAVGNTRNIANPPFTKGRPRGAFKRTTTRDPSGFEHVEGAVGKRRCGKCNGIGHNVQTCNLNDAKLA